MAAGVALLVSLLSACQQQTLPPPPPQAMELPPVVMVPEKDEGARWHNAFLLRYVQDKNGDQAFPFYLW